MFEHKAHKGSAFCKKYNLEELMYFELFDFIHDAIDREKQLKRWHKEWKWNLIKTLNPDLIDLSKSWFDGEDMDDIMKFRLSDEPRFNDFPALDGSDPETSSG
jgi:predicted GIY-YIG superfamily endonuclease